MTMAFVAVLVAGVLPLVCAGIAKAGWKDYDNRDPRAWLAKQTGFRARANAAQANSFEAFPFFAAAVVLATFTQADATSVNLLAFIFVASRMAYIACYLADKASARSVFWAVGYGATIWLYVLAIWS
nr:MAPEG family protein [uncultured Limnohabitans sp.]